MELSRRSLFLVNRLLKRSVTLCTYRQVNGSAALKEDFNVELLNSFNKDIRAGGVVPVFRRALLFPSRVALQDDIGIYTYAGLHRAATELSEKIAVQLVGEKERTISYMCSNDASHVIVQWAIWMTGNIAVPLTPMHPPEMLKYYISDSTSELIVCTQEYENTLRPISLETSTPLLTMRRDKEVTAQLYQPDSTFTKQIENNLEDVGESNKFYGNVEAMIIYTSGTTSKPKGVLWTHQMMGTQIAALQSAWQYSANDVVLHALPLHHVHGQLNSLNASLASGSRIRMLPSFTSHNVWARLLGMSEKDEAKVTVFHGVPAMYAKLVAEYERMFADKRTKEYVRSTLSSRMRLMCAGSAPLPAALYQKWEEISGHRLLERYGMSEVGMALSNPYESDGRTVGKVGLPLPGVAARIAVPSDDDPKAMIPLVTVECEAPELQICLNRLGLISSQDVYVDSDKYNWSAPKITEHKVSNDKIYQGELLLKGPSVFHTYWNKDTKIFSKDFTKDGWFRTGDTAMFAENKFQILGRTSMDIIKTSGYKVSALQVESAILDHPNVLDVAVVGVDDETRGESIVAVVVFKPDTSASLDELKEVCGKQLTPYQLPRHILVLNEISRNTMGKLDKKKIKQIVIEKLYNKK